MVWWMWLIAALVLGIIEVTTITFVILWIAIAALITAILSPVIPTAWGQVGIFVVVSVILLVATRPLVRKWKQQRNLPNRSEAFVGEDAVVVHAAEPGAFATVRVKGELWSARSNHSLVEGQTVRIREMSATVVTVDPVEEA